MRVCVCVCVCVCVASPSSWGLGCCLCICVSGVCMQRCLSVCLSACCDGFTSFFWLPVCAWRGNGRHDGVCGCSCVGCVCGREGRGGTHSHGEGHTRGERAHGEAGMSCTSVCRSVGQLVGWLLLGVISVSLSWALYAHTHTHTQHTRLSGQSAGACVGECFTKSVLCCAVLCCAVLHDKTDQESPTGVFVRFSSTKGGMKMTGKDTHTS